MTGAKAPDHWSRGKLVRVESCPACGSPDRSATYSRRDDACEMPDVWHMHRCAGCRSLYLDPRPDDNSLAEAYRNYYTHSADKEFAPTKGAEGALWSLIHGYLDWRFDLKRLPANPLGIPVFLVLQPFRLKLDYYGRHLPHGKSEQDSALLDVGCGNGTFLLRAREMGWDVAGCEPDARAVDACKRAHLDVIEGDAFHPSLDTRQFDVITVSHVLEHVIEPVRLLRRIFSLLKPGGSIWLAMPNAGAVGLRIFRDAWMPLHCPYHLLIPSQSALRQWLVEAGFESIRPLRRGVHAASYWARSIEIAAEQNLQSPPRASLMLSRTLSDFLASFSWRHAEELVVLASKPAYTRV